MGDGGTSCVLRLYQPLRERGAQFLAEPVDWGYEVRAFCRDPDGHLFEISEAVSG